MDRRHRHALRPRPDRLRQDFIISQLEKLAVQALTDRSLQGERKAYITVIDLAGNVPFDLLDSRKPVSILEDVFGGDAVGWGERGPGSEDALGLIETATGFRRTAKTVKNDASSRSHGICRIRIHDPGKEADGLLCLVDLAGSEAARDVAVHGADRMRRRGR